jgi:predicted RNA binding protein YcfA (HicA-like mRNA interferase family)
MHKPPSITSQKVIKILERKGFILDRAKDSHRIYYYYKSRRRVVIPYHRKDLPKGTLIEILKQAGINKEELEKLL